MISLNGIPIPEYTLDQLTWVGRRIPVHELQPFDASSGKPTTFILMLPPRVPTPPVRIGVLNWPKDASRFATFHCVITEDQLALIDPGYPGVAATYTSGSSADTLCNVRDWTLVLDDGNVGNVITTIMHPLSPVPLQDIAGSYKYYLITLVDERYYWWWRSGQITVTEGVTTWSNVFDQLSALIEISPTRSAIDADFDRPTRLMQSDFLPAPLLLDAAAMACGFRVVRWFDGTVNLQSPDDALPRYDTAVAAWAGEKLAGGESAQANLVWDVPEKVCLSFNKVNNSSDIVDGQYAVTVDLNDTGIAAFVGVGGRCGTLPMFGQELATYSSADGSGTPTNAETLRKYAVKWAEKYYRWLLRRPNFQYAGVVPFEPTSYADAIEVHHHSEFEQVDAIRNPGGHRVTTRVLPVPWNWKETGAPKIVGAGMSDGGFWARLTTKTYPAFGGYIEYQFDRVADTDDPDPITWTDATQDSLPAYEVNNVDVPVSPSGTLYSGGQDDHPTIVRMYKGAGSYYLFRCNARWEFVKQTSQPDITTGESSCQLVYYDQSAEEFKLGESGILLDVNSQGL